MNIAHGTPVAVPDLLATIEDIIGGRLDVTRQPHRAGDTSQTHGDSSLASLLLGWRALTDLRTGLEQQVAWHRGRLERADLADADADLRYAEVAR
jgi:UDP-glucose 4-epimerase